MNNKAVYTAIIGNYEELKEPSVTQTGFDFYCFTDQDIKSDTWNIIKIEPDLEPQRMARKIKLLPHVYLPNYEYTFWLDAAFKININLDDWWNKHFKGYFTVPSHPIRKCVYGEMRSVIVNRRADAEEVKKQEIAYKERGMPSMNGIITSGVLMRRNTQECVNLCNEWWEELSNYSTRDQIAFAFVCRKYQYFVYRWDYSQSKELSYIKHFKYRH